MQTELKAINRVSGDETYLQANQASEGLNAQGSARYEDLVRSGRAFTMKSTAVVAAVTSLPTTAVNCAFYNTDPDGGRSIIVDAVFAEHTTNAGAVLDQSTIIWNLGQTRIIVTTMADSALIPRKLNGLGPTTDTCVRMSIAAETLDIITGVAIAWHPIGNSVNTAVTTLPGSQIWAPVDGRIIVPPGRFFALHVLSSSTGIDFNMGMVWHERRLTLA